MASADDLSNAPELLSITFSYLDLSQLPSTRLVCRAWEREATRIVLRKPSLFMIQEMVKGGRHPNSHGATVLKARVFMVMAFMNLVTNAALVNPDALQQLTLGIPNDGEEHCSGFMSRENDAPPEPCSMAQEFEQPRPLLTALVQLNILRLLGSTLATLKLHLPPAVSAWYIDPVQRDMFHILDVIPNRCPNLVFLSLNVSLCDKGGRAIRGKQFITMLERLEYLQELELGHLTMRGVDETGSEALRYLAVDSKLWVLRFLPSRNFADLARQAMDDWGRRDSGLLQFVDVMHPQIRSLREVRFYPGEVGLLLARCPYLEEFQLYFMGSNLSGLLLEFCAVPLDCLTALRIHLTLLPQDFPMIANTALLFLKDLRTLITLELTGDGPYAVHFFDIPDRMALMPFLQCFPNLENLALHVIGGLTARHLQNLALYAPRLRRLSLVMRLEVTDVCWMHTVFPALEEFGVSGAEHKGIAFGTDSTRNMLTVLTICGWAPVLRRLWIGADRDELAIRAIDFADQPTRKVDVKVLTAYASVQVPVRRAKLEDCLKSLENDCDKGPEVLAAFPTVERGLHNGHGWYCSEL